MSVHIDCDTCVVRGLACHDCVVTVLLGPPPELGFDDDEQRALDVLAESGLVPPLRMVAPVRGPDVASAVRAGAGPSAGRCARVTRRYRQSVTPRRCSREFAPGPGTLSLAARRLHSRPDRVGSGTALSPDDGRGPAVVRSRGTTFLGSIAARRADAALSGACVGFFAARTRQLTR